MQHLSLKWSSFSFATYENCNYVRVKRDFILADSKDFTTALVKSNDMNVGIFITIPSKRFNLFLEVDVPGKQMWTQIRDIIANINGDKKSSYKELWIPGFRSETSSSDMLQGLVGSTINGNYIETVGFGM